MSVISAERIASAPPGSLVPLSLQFSPDGRLLTYLFPDEKSNSRQLYSVDCSSEALEANKMIDMSAQAATLSPEEALRRERMRLFADGIVSYEWNGTQSSNQKVTVPFNGKVLQFDPSTAHTGQYRVLYDAEAGSCIDPHMAPDNSAVAFVMKDNLWVQHVVTNGTTTTDVPSTPVRVTANGLLPGIQCGGADYIAQEEMDRYRGYWWSPNSKFIAYTETDENAVCKYEILHQGKDDPKHSETHRYPFAGETNPFVKLAVLPVPEASSDCTAVPDYIWMNIADADSGYDIDPNDYYLGRVGWWSDGSVMAQVQNRSQSTLQLLRLDPATGTRTILLTEDRPGLWVNLYDMLYEDFPADWTPTGIPKVAGDFYFLWASERSGFAQIYLYHYIAAENRCQCLLDGTPIGGGGDWVVEAINAVDAENCILYFSGNRGNLMEKHLFCASFASTTAAASIKKLTKQAGTHNVAVSVQLNMFADIYSSLAALPTLTLHSLPHESYGAGGVLKELLGRDRSHMCPSDTLIALVPHITPPTIEVIRSADDLVDLYCAVYRPDPATFGTGPFPCIVSVYGGPHVMRVLDTWGTSADLRAQRYAKEGYVVIRCDNRGTYRRGLAFEGALRYDMGNIEIKDQQTAVEYFVSQGLVDAARVGMFGWSYGGYMSAMAVCRAPETFCLGIAGAPVTSWDGYDTHYTERYMGTPGNNPEGYKASSVMSYVSGMTGKLMLIHGLIDENVHFRHTARLINELIKHRKRYDLVLFPCERHSPHKLQDRVYLEDRMLDFIVEHCPPNEARESICEGTPLVLVTRVPPSPPKAGNASARSAL